MPRITIPKLPSHTLQRSESAWIGVTALHLQGEPVLDVRLWRRSEASVDEEDIAPTGAGFVVPFRDVPAFIACLETAAREAAGT
jgi:hypothetical protein